MGDRRSDLKISSSPSANSVRCGNRTPTTSPSVSWQKLLTLLAHLCTFDQVPSKSRFLDVLMTEPSGPELVIGLVGAIGADLGLLVEGLKAALSDVSYTADEIRVVDLLHDIERWKDLPHHPEERRYEEHIKAGAEFCQDVGRGDALAILSIARI